MAKSFFETGRQRFAICAHCGETFVAPQSLGASIMMMIYSSKDKEMRIKTMREKLGGSKSAYTGALANLKRRGLRTFRVDKTQRRKRVFYRLSAKGEREVKQWLAKKRD